MEAPSSSRLGKKRVEWDLNSWKWDGNEFLATPLNINKTPCPENYCQVVDFGDIDKKRKTIVIEDDEFDSNLGNCGGNVTLNLFGNSGRTSEVLQVGVKSRSPSCQVEGCNADLKSAKDYHRRHKVCDVHSKAASAMVNNAVQRFCQQCSRFHLLTEFDEERRSCRRRLDGHNKRRRKTNQGSSNNGHSTNDNQATYYLLISLLQVLSNLHSGTSTQSKDQELVSQILQTLATVAGSFDASTFSTLLQAIQDTQKRAKSAEITSEIPDGLTTGSILEQTSAKEQPLIHKPISTVPSLHGTDISGRKKYAEVLPDSCVEKVKYKEFDLNTIYSDAENCDERNENIGAGSPISPSCILQDSHESSPQRMSGNNSDSTSGQPQSLSIGDSKSRTGKIVFKLFGKDPNDIPPHMRSQILDWLCNSPTDIESYIRPGCIILTIYLHQAESAWGELCSDLFSNLNRLLHSSSNSFWRTGWIYARIQEHVSFIYNGKILLSTPRLLGSPYLYEIASVSPIAVAISSRVKFTVKGFDLAQSTGRLLCAFEGNYLSQETTGNVAEDGSDHDNFQCLSFTCLFPNNMGRGFIEVEDNCLGSSFFPFIVAKHDVCSEIRTLEKLIDVSLFEDDLMDARTEALKFLDEMGWLLSQKQLKSSRSNNYSLLRFKWLISFAMDQDWHAVVKNLLDILFEGTIIATAGTSPNEIALEEGLLQIAVCKNSRSMIEALLRYKPVNSDAFLFRPDLPLDPTSITPLHVAASIIGSESVLDALTDDPGQCGLKAWKTARDITGLTPEDYARSRGHESYLNLVQKKIDKQQMNNKSHIIAIPHLIFSKQQAFETEKNRSISCKLCSQQMMHRPPIKRPFLYRPTMLSMVAIAAVCVCVGLLFKGPPEVFGVVHPFRWEKLRYGSI